MAPQQFKCLKKRHLTASHPGRAIVALEQDAPGEVDPVKSLRRVLISD